MTFALPESSLEDNHCLSNPPPDPAQQAWWVIPLFSLGGLSQHSTEGLGPGTEDVFTLMILFRRFIDFFLICRLRDLLVSNICLCAVNDSLSPDSPLADPVLSRSSHERRHIPSLSGSRDIRGQRWLCPWGSTPFNWVGRLTQGIGCDGVSTPQPRASPVVPVSLEKDLHWKRSGPEACSSRGPGFTLQNLPSSNLHSFGPHCTGVSNRVTWAEKCQRIYYFTEGFKHQPLIV